MVTRLRFQFIDITKPLVRNFDKISFKNRSRLRRSHYHLINESIGAAITGEFGLWCIMFNI